MSIDLKKYTVKPSTSIHQVIKKIDLNGRELAIVADDQLKVLGTITDGDIRRAILKNIALKDPAKKIMNPKPSVIDRRVAKAEALHIMKTLRIRQLPVVSASGKLQDILFIHDLVDDHSLSATAIIMAGGEGKRLRPMTIDTPKPMLKVGRKPILETIIDKLRQDGIKDIYIAINYKGDQIRSYFKDGKKFGVNIGYLEETCELGTAGALSLIPRSVNNTLLILNADLLTFVSFQGILSFHESGNYDMTVAVKEYDYQVPYGVVCIGKDFSITHIDEKPIQRFFVNAGIYTMSADCLSCIKKEEYLDMPTLIASFSKMKKKVGAFPIHEYWLDIGLQKDFEKANLDYKARFGIEK